MTRVLVTGAAGQLGRELLRVPAPASLEIVGLDRNALDITDAAAVAAAADAHRPDAIINAAAYTAVDRAESEPDVAERVNASGVGHLAAAAAACRARLIHVSTDYVFDGTKDGWYVESDPVSPLGVYGWTKAKGEEAARALERHLIVRIAWVYSATPPNFVTTMLRLADERDELGVVADQVGCPTSAADVAAALLTLVSDTGTDAEQSGTFHLASPQQATWFEFADAILADHQARGAMTLRPITTADYPTPASRPANSRLDSSKIRGATGLQLPPWSESLPGVLAEVLESADGPPMGRE